MAGNPAVDAWVRLHTFELPILWNSAGREYNPNLIVIDADRTHWVVEVKMDKEMDSADVKGKREAARRWANHVTSDERSPSGGAICWRRKPTSRPPEARGQRSTS